MIAARQNRLILGSEGIDAGALGFAFRPLWQLDETARAGLALAKAQAFMNSVEIGRSRPSRS